MTIQIESIVLPELLWIDETEFTGVDSRTEKTMTGRLHVWEQETKGRPITLAGEIDSGWITRGSLLELQKMASVPMAVYLLVYENRNFMVRFRNEEEGKPITASPIIKRSNGLPSDWYINVLIKLMEV